MFSSTIVKAFLFLFAEFGTCTHLPSRQLTAGTAACASLTFLLGNKVECNRLSVRYLSTQQGYWNSKQSEYNPACILYPKSAQDVSLALQAIKATGSRFAIKAGGHNPNDFFSSVDQGVLISLESMTQRHYDPVTKLATYQPGGKFGEIYEYFAQFNRTVVGARLAGVGTGLALGGGLSYLSGQYGLAVDGFHELEVVIPSGKIVTANAKINPDLFLALKGGGGNAYGVVTRYIVQSRPIGTFTAGNLIFIAPKDDLLYAIGNFTLYNNDPKAAIIGTYQKQSIPDPKTGLDSAAVMFLVYDGPNPGTAFDNFTRLNPLVNTLGSKTYLEVINLPAPMTAELTRGNNIFRIQTHHISSTDFTHVKAFKIWEDWCQKNKGSYMMSSIDYQPIPKSLTDASKAQGGNALGGPSGPYLWLNYLLTTPPGIPDSVYRSTQASFRDMVNSIASAPDLPLFGNDAFVDQNPLKSYGTYRQLQAAKRKYDPDGFFANSTGGWNFNV